MALILRKLDPSTIQAPPSGRVTVLVNEEGLPGFVGEDGVFRIFQGPSFAPDASGLFEDRDDYDEEPAGFVYLSTDGDGDELTTGVLFVKASAASGDWSPPVLFQGDRGPVGPMGPSFSPDAIGTFAERDSYDEEDEGFSYLSTDGDGDEITRAVVFFKGDGSGVWLGPVPFEGAEGDKGEQGERGAFGFGINAIGTLEERDAFDNEFEGFIYVSVDGDGQDPDEPSLVAGFSTAVLYILTDEPGVWLGPVPFQGGPGPAGPAFIPEPIDVPVGYVPMTTATGVEWQPAPSGGGGLPIMSAQYIMGHTFSTDIPEGTQELPP